MDICLDYLPSELVKIIILYTGKHFNNFEGEIYQKLYKEYIQQITKGLVYPDLLFVFNEDIKTYEGEYPINELNGL